MAQTFQSETFVWTSTFETGITAIDQHHRRLVDMLNTLANQVAGGASKEVLLALLDEMAAYAVEHFRMEEDLMQRHRVDDAFDASHRHAHGTFIRQAREARAMVAENPDKTAGQLVTFLTKWLVFHILGVDMRLAKEVLALQRGASPEEARNEALAHMSDSSEVLLEAMNTLYDNLGERTHELLEANRRLHDEIDMHERTEHELRKLSRAVEFNPASIIITDKSGAIEYVNPRFTQTTGYRLSEVRGQTPRLFKSGATSADEYERLWATITRGKEWSGTFKNRKKNGELFWEKATISPIVDTLGKITHFIAIKEDITDKKEAEEALRRSNELLSATLSKQQRQTRDLTVLNQMNELLQTCLTQDEAYRVIARMAVELELGRCGALAIAPGSNAGEMETVARWGRDNEMLEIFTLDQCWAIRRGHLHETIDPAHDLLCSHFHGTPGGPSLCIPLVVQGETIGLLHVGAFRDYSDDCLERLRPLATTVGEAIKLAISNIRLREALHDQAIRDPLTRLYNRRYLDDTLPREIQRSQRNNGSIALAMLDIDHFKQFNDRHGHEAGDLVLTEVGQTLLKALRTTDLCCRYGGEELLIVMPDSGIREAIPRLEEVTRRIRGLNLQLGSVTLPPVTVSIGVAEFPRHGRDMDSLVRAADQAMYQAKTSGRDRICQAPADD